MIGHESQYYTSHHSQNPNQTHRSFEIEADVEEYSPESGIEHNSVGTVMNRGTSTNRNLELPESSLSRMLLHEQPIISGRDASQDLASYPSSTLFHNRPDLADRGPNLSSSQEVHASGVSHILNQPALSDYSAYGHGYNTAFATSSSPSGAPAVSYSHRHTEIDPISLSYVPSSLTSSLPHLSDPSPMEYGQSSQPIHGHSHYRPNQSHHSPVYHHGPVHHQDLQRIQEYKGPIGLQPPVSQQMVTSAEMAQRAPRKIEWKSLPRSEIYGNWANFNGVQEAKLYLSKVWWKPAGADNDSTIPRDDGEIIDHAARLYYAMQDFTTGFADKIETQNKVNRLVSERYHQKEMEARCIEAALRARRLHEEGSTLFPCSDITFEPKSKTKDKATRGRGNVDYKVRPKAQADRDLSFEDRWVKLCKAVTECKAVATDILDGQKMDDAIYAPTMHLETKLANMKNNDDKQDKLKAYQDTNRSVDQGITDDALLKGRKNRRRRNESDFEDNEGGAHIISKRRRFGASSLV
jgi:hypothetical protein